MAMMVDQSFILIAYAFVLTSVSKSTHLLPSVNLSGTRSSNRRGIVGDRRSDFSDLLPSILYFRKRKDVQHRYCIIINANKTIMRLYSERITTLNGKTRRNYLSLGTSYEYDQGRLLGICSRGIVSGVYVFVFCRHGIAAFIVLEKCLENILPTNNGEYIYTTNAPLAHDKRCDDTV